MTVDHHPYMLGICTSSVRILADFRLLFQSDVHRPIANAELPLVLIKSITSAKQCQDVH